MTHRAVQLLAAMGALTFAQAGLAQTSTVRNLDKTLDEEISVDFKDQALDGVISALRDQTQTNIVPNWTALADAGIVRSTPVTLHLTHIPYEFVIRSVLLTLPARPGTSVNFVIGDNAVELTTNAELAKSMSTRLYPVGPLLARPLSGKATADPLPGRAELLQQLLRSALAAIGEPVEPPDRSLTIRGDFLALTASRRAQACVLKILVMMEDPEHLGGVPAGAAESVRAKRAAEQLKSFASPSALLAAPASDTLNVLVLPGARAAAPQDLATFIDDAGIIQVGPSALLQHRVVVGAYDLADLLRRRTMRSKAVPADELTALVSDLKARVHPEIWGNPLTRLTWLAVYANELIVQAPPKIHQEIATRLQELYK